MLLDEDWDVRRTGLGLLKVTCHPKAVNRRLHGHVDGHVDEYAETGGDIYVYV